MRETPGSFETNHVLSWIEAANDPQQGFPLASLPYCAFHGADGVPRLGVGIGDEVLNLRAAAELGHIAEGNTVLREVCRNRDLNALMACGPSAWSTLRSDIMSLLHADADKDVQQNLRPLLCPMDEVRFALPVTIGDYTDFYASRDHAMNVGKLFRPERPLLPNYDWVPIGYHGRASSIVISGTAVQRPRGQQLLPGSAQPVFEATKQLDYEVELAAYIGVGNDLGSAVAIGDAASHIFGYSLLNDWSARDIQSWEYQPLGPFLGKSFATSVSPWVVPADALEAYRLPARPRDNNMPKPLRYLAEAADARSALDVQTEVWLRSADMAEAGEAPVLVSSGNAETLHWSFAQMIAHHTSNGCNLRVGDLLASGTVSGSSHGSEGCLLERTKRGVDRLVLPNGEERAFLQDGDEVILRAFCEREGLSRISLGECRGKVLPAR